MAGRRARTGRGWDAAPPRTRRSAPASSTPAEPGTWARRTVDSPPSAPPDPYEEAREICLRQLSVRPRTRAELATALRKQKIADDVAASVLDRYDEVGLIDDAAFARAWVTSRHHSRGLARRALASELRQRGVDTEVVDAALDDLDGATEIATARALVDRKLRSMSSGSPEAIFRRLVSMLARKGYPPGVAIGAVKDALAERAQSASDSDTASGLHIVTALDIDELTGLELSDDD